MSRAGWPDLAGCAPIVAALLAVGVPCGVAAQSAAAAQQPAVTAQQPAFGVIAGLNRASFGGGGAVDVTARTGPMFGVVADLPIAETFSIRPELHFSAKGSRVRTQAGDAAEGPVKGFELPYVQMPVLAQLRTAPGSSMRPHLFGGLSVGALLGCSLGALDCADVDEIDQRGVDLGVLAGAELELGRVGVGVRYEAGVRAVEASVPGNEIYNGVLSFTARYMFRP